MKKCNIGECDRKADTFHNSYIENLFENKPEQVDETNDIHGNLIYMENDTVIRESEELPIFFNILDNMKGDMDEISNNLSIITKDILNNFNINYSEFSSDLEPY